MQCQSCGADLTRAQYVKVEWEDFAVDLFCDRVCLQAFLEAEKPLTGPESEPEKPELSPQPVVVIPYGTFRFPGESDAEVVERLERYKRFVK